MIRNICIICLLLSGLMTEAQIRLLPGGQAQVSNLDSPYGGQLVCIDEC